MPGLRYKIINAFSNGSSPGNPAGVVYLSKGEQLTVAQMQEIARQEKGIVYEVAFCSPINKGLYDLKYYSSECEVEFCGHATIACMYDLIKNNSALSEAETLTIRTIKGELLVFNDTPNSDSVFIAAPVPEYHYCNISIEDITNNLGISNDGINHNLPVSLLNAGLDTLIVPISSFNVIMEIMPDCRQLEKFCINNNIDIILVFTSEVFEQAHMYRTRVFAPKYGYLEDPATGSGNAAFGYYLLQRGMWNDDKIISLEQGPSRNNPNIVKLHNRFLDGVQQVLFGGKAIVQNEKQI